ncbi:type IV pilus modification protein PilV [Variovorax sp. OV329]|uniref:type IV pilus modification protein PilV n=1 Tax=Variovorax sp. OV329 TaxID=1882825 RepID=UPI0008F0C032|nr:type IV pilus modification protein PilV [Variovorax sp. OV329]SFN15887.1 type IV pilus modification protein PilV [Variovorax sp. OV329]
MPGLTLPSQRCSGVALLEAMIALAILGATLLGLLYMQVRTLADAENALRQTQALHLIDDLADRIRANPAGFRELGSYRSDWGPAPAPEADCEAQWCDPGQLARWDLAKWKRHLALALPQGNALVFDSPQLPPGDTRRMLGVMVAWHSRLGETFRVSVPGATCPASNACQFGHVQP